MQEGAMNFLQQIERVNVLGMVDINEISRRVIEERDNFFIKHI